MSDNHKQLVGKLIYWANILAIPNITTFFLSQEGYPYITTWWLAAIAFASLLCYVSAGAIWLANTAYDHRHAKPKRKREEIA